MRKKREKEVEMEAEEEDQGKGRKRVMKKIKGRRGRGTNEGKKTQNKMTPRLKEQNEHDKEEKEGKADMRKLC